MGLRERYKGRGKERRRGEGERSRGEVNMDRTRRRGKNPSQMVCWGLFTDAVVERERGRARGRVEQGILAMSA